MKLVKLVNHSYICPNCKRKLISRMSPLCNWCGAKVPEVFLYTETERQQIEREEAERREQINKIAKENMERLLDD
jgi:hypothetical protein